MEQRTTATYREMAAGGIKVTILTRSHVEEEREKDEGEKSKGKDQRAVNRGRLQEE